MTKRLIISCEFFPAKTAAGIADVAHVRHQLTPLNPVFYSVTFGAGGSAQTNTLDTVITIQQNKAVTGIDAAPHLSCIGATEDTIRDLLNTFKANGIHRLVALRGDLPSWMRDLGDFRYANELVAFIRQQSGDHFTIEVAAYPEVHPQADSASRDFAHFKRKVEAGADGALTQYFYNIDAYLYFVERCQRHGIDIPIVPGIMPINDFARLLRFSNNCGADIPRWLQKRLADHHDDSAALQAFTLDFLTDFTQKLIEAGAPGLHFYTMNRVEPTLTICQRLGLLQS